MISVRRLLIGLAFAFMVYLAARGLWWAGGDVNRPFILIGSVVFYILATVIVVLWGGRAAAEKTETGPVSADPAVSAGLKGLRARVVRMPILGALLAVVTAAIVPAALTFSVPESARNAPYVTWYLGGIGALMVVVMVRRRPVFAWIGTAILIAISSAALGPVPALLSGLLGSIVWVAMAQLIVLLTDRATVDTGKLVELQRSAAAWQAAHAVRQRERRVQIQRALSVAGPILTHTIAQGGALSPEEKVEARLAEGSLRDELRAARLLDDAVRHELEAARRRGATVTVLDEGGLEGIDGEELEIIRRELAATLHEARSDRLFIRTSPHERVAVTVVGRSDSGRGLSDEDTVDLWREIVRHPAVVDEPTP
ncbi:hypothetical protein GCM10009808_02440 [Microbacterium sediminicola]|uniref:Signal transduction histidine kinase n=1 Tax=Microbacterium sediminicola TaxID=415210 RepID=A0ABN2HJH4_9MICO